MKLLERVIKEALRLFPSVPFIGRKVTRDTEIGKILNDRSSIPSLYGVHRRKKTNSIHNNSTVKAYLMT